jgi:hypothetical protein
MALNIGISKMGRLKIKTFDTVPVGREISFPYVSSEPLAFSKYFRREAWTSFLFAGA